MRDVQYVRQISLLCTNSEVVKNDISLFVFEWCAVGFCFLGFLNVGENLLVHFTSWFTLLCTDNMLTKFIYSCKVQLQMYITSIPGWEITGRSSYLTRTTLFVVHVRHNAFQSILAVLRVVCSSVVEIRDFLPLLQDCFSSKLHVNWETVTSGSLPACSSNPTATDFKETTCRVLRNFVGAKSYNEWCYVVWLEGLDHFLRKNCSGHGSTSVGSNCVDINVVLCSLTSKCTRETKDTAFLKLLAGVKYREIALTAAA
jgi:hypothetical protein